MSVYSWIHLLHFAFSVWRLPLQIFLFYNYVKYRHDSKIKSTEELYLEKSTSIPLPSTPIGDLFPL